MLIVNALNAKNINVQLVHDDTETTWENHGFINITFENDEHNVRVDDFQHNRKYREMQSRAAEIADKVASLLNTEQAAASS